MGSRSSIAVLCIALFPLAVGGVAAQARAPDTRPGIAVMPFDNGGSYGQDKENFDALQKGIAGMLISELAQNPAARRGQRDKAVDMYQRAIAVFPEYAEAAEGLQRLKNS